MTLRDATSALRAYLKLLGNHNLKKLHGNGGYYAIIRKFKTKPFPIDHIRLGELGFTYSHTNAYRDNNKEKEEVIIIYNGKGK